MAAGDRPPVAAPDAAGDRPPVAAPTAAGDRPPDAAPTAAIGRGTVGSAPTAAPDAAATAVIGPGAVGSALVAALVAVGWPIAGVAARTRRAATAAGRRLGVPALGSARSPAPGLAAAPLVLIAVRDPDVAGVAAELAAAAGPWSGRVACHVSGALGTEALAPLAAAGAATGALHPLMTFPPPGAGGPAPLPADTPFFFAGSRRAGSAARRLVAALGCPFRVLPPGAQPLYHVAATVAGNLTTALLAAAAEILAAAGLSPNDLRYLAPLARESVARAARLGPAAARTGPVARGDVATVRGHLQALAAAGLPADLRAAHAALTRIAVGVARRQGRCRPADLDAILELLSGVGGTEPE